MFIYKQMNNFAESQTFEYRFKLAKKKYFICGNISVFSLWKRLWALR